MGNRLLGRSELMSRFEVCESSIFGPYAFFFGHKRFLQIGSLFTQEHNERKHEMCRWQIRLSFDSSAEFIQFSKSWTKFASHAWFLIVNDEARIQIVDPTLHLVSEIVLSSSNETSEVVRLRSPSKGHTTNFREDPNTNVVGNWPYDALLHLRGYVWHFPLKQWLERLLLLLEQIFSATRYATKSKHGNASKVMLEFQLLPEQPMEQEHCHAKLLTIVYYSSPKTTKTAVAGPPHSPAEKVLQKQQDERTTYGPNGSRQPAEVDVDQDKRTESRIEKRIPQDRTSRCTKPDSTVGLAPTSHTSSQDPKREVHKLQFALLVKPNAHVSPRFPPLDLRTFGQTHTCLQLTLPYVSFVRSMRTLAPIEQKTMVVEQVEKGIQCSCHAQNKSATLLFDSKTNLIHVSCGKYTSYQQQFPFLCLLHIANADLQIELLQWSFGARCTTLEASSTQDLRYRFAILCAEAAPCSPIGKRHPDQCPSIPQLYQEMFQNPNFMSLAEYQRHERLSSVPSSVASADMDEVREASSDSITNGIAANL